MNDGRAMPPRSLSRRSWLPWLLWLLLLGASALVLLRTAISTDITAFLPGPATRAQALLAEQLRDGVAARVMLIGIDLPADARDEDAQRAAEVSRRLALALRADPAVAFVSNGAAAGFEAELNALLAARYLLSPQVTEAAFTVEGLHAGFSRLEQLLRSAAAPLVGRVAPRDPTGELLAVLGQLGGGLQQPFTRDGVWFTRDGRTALLLAQTRAPGFDIDAQQAAVAAVQAAFEASRAAAAPGTSLTLQLAGPGVFAVESRAVIERDAQRLSIAATVVIMLLLYAVLRSARFLLLAALPTVTGVVAGLATVSLGFGTIHGITLGFGATLVGEAVDYAVYVQVQRQSEDARRLWRLLWLAVLTSCAGFVAMMLSGFQGLVQLGLFSLVGLVSAALVARYLLPPILVPLEADRVARFDGLQRLTAAAPRARVPLLLLAAASVALLAWRAPTLWNDELAAISPLARASGELDARLRGDLGLPDLRWLVAVDGRSVDEALSRAEQLAPRLALLREARAIGGFDSPADLLPSAATQRVRQQALPPADILRERLGQALAGSNFRAEAFEPFVADVESARARAPLTLADFAGTGLGQRLQGQVLTHAGGATVLVTLRGVADAEALRSAIITVPGALLVDLKGDVEALIADYRARAAWAALAGLALIALLLAWQVRRRAAGVRIALALAAAVAITAAILVLLAGRLTLFHLVALLLVVGIGSNYALFFGTLDEAADAREAAATRLSVLLCAASTFVAFTLLAASSTPVLHMIGLTVGIGSVVSFVTSLVLATPPTSSAHAASA